MCDAPNFEECAKIGKEMKYKSNQVNNRLSIKNITLIFFENSCMLEVRKRGNDYTQVCMGCKEDDVCKNQKKNNFLGNRPAQFQCRVGKNVDTNGPSVCRQCCNKPFCTGKIITGIRQK